MMATKAKAMIWDETVPAPEDISIEADDVTPRTIRVWYDKVIPYLKAMDAVDRVVLIYVGEDGNVNLASKPAEEK